MSTIHIDDLRIESIANSRFNRWTGTAKKRVQDQHMLAALATTKKPALPVVVTLRRIGPREIDDDNLAGGFKRVRDRIAEWLGCDDGDKSRVRWVYEQVAIGKREYAVQVEFVAVTAAEKRGASSPSTGSYRS